MSLTKVILVNASSDSNSQDTIGGYLNWCLQSQFEIFFSSIHHFCLKCQGMLDTSTIIVCSVLGTRKKKQGHFVKKWKSYCTYTLESGDTIVHTPLCLILILLPMYIIKYWCEAITLAVCKQAKGHTILQQVRSTVLCIKHIFYCPPSDNMSVINCRSNAFCCW